MPARKYSPEERAAAKMRRSITARKWRTVNAARVKVKALLWVQNNRDKLNARARRWRANNRAKHRQYTLAYEAANREKRRAQRKAWKENNREGYAEWSRRYYEANRAKIRSYISKWAKQNKAHLRASALLRNSRMKLQLHPDNDENAASAFYTEAARMTKETGILHHVDHIIPLDAGGWHHHLNLQILPHYINTSKATDPFWEHEGFRSWKTVPSFLWPEILKGEYIKKSEVVSPVSV